MTRSFILAGSFACLFIGFTIIGAAIGTPQSAPQSSRSLATVTPQPRYTWACYDRIQPAGSAPNRECKRVEVYPDENNVLTVEVRQP